MTAGAVFVLFAIWGLSRFVREIAGNPANPSVVELGLEDAEEDPRASFAVDPSFQNWNYEKDTEKTVYLTFDDGPSENTLKILDILDRYGVKATFFVTAQLPACESYIAEAYRRGHTIGLHTYSHNYGIYASEENYFEDLEKIGMIVERQIGYVPCFIRFPGGTSNEASKEYCEGIMSVLSEKVLERGYQYYDWNVTTGDGAGSITAEEAAANALATDETAVMLLAHDGEKKETTVEALPAIIEEYQARGYVFKAIDRSSMVLHHPIYN
ncbi:MAG: polysaccharide deacetylase [Lachnospiraceae bacterium]|nr:polysaccharide deacetylase [Lachnospiraceae bacterium]